MRIVLLLSLISIVVGCSSPAQLHSCDRYFGAAVEFQTNQEGALESVRFDGVYDCKEEPIEMEIPQWWKLGACAALASWHDPTYEKGEEPATLWAVFVFDTLRPNRIQTPTENSYKNPIYWVDEKLENAVFAEDTLGVCVSPL